MNISLILFISSINQEPTVENTQSLVKTFESDFRPQVGDIIDDPGFDSGFHNGYEVVKVTINYTLNECFVSLVPLAIEVEKIRVEDYIKKLKTYGWSIQSR
ncbi:hypothetical protein [Carnobacterium sp. 17-4]|uniref:hypothetical protein n=1 Tax=Carnobacterium sp. (strain 17-4) TaxID=208596 RepID=UPI0002F1326B|nr:hypothetical protein [Carnobacterium sp. 17-4]